MTLHDVQCVGCTRYPASPVPAVTVQQLAAIAAQLPGWIPRFFATAETLISLTVHLVLRCEQGALSVLQLLLRAADPGSGHGPEVRRAADHLLGETARDGRAAVERSGDGRGGEWRG